MSGSLRSPLLHAASASAASIRSSSAHAINGDEVDHDALAPAVAPDDDDVSLSFPSLFVLPGLPQLAAFVLVATAAALAFTVLRGPLEEHGVTSDDVLRYGSIPIVSVAFTYVHIWLALWMTFYPLSFTGLAQIPGTNVGLGWQGIIPFKAEKMARMAVRLMTTRLFDVREIFARLEPAQVAAEMGPVLRETLEDVIGGVARAHAGDLWTLLPAGVKRELMDKAHEDAPPLIAELMLTLQQDITSVFDIEEMVVSSLVRDKALLCDIFIQCGHRELSFIRNSGAYMGGLFGLVQMTIWIFWQNKWLLPGFGGVVGLLTNWLALKMIFQPVHARYPCGKRGMRIQGLFLQRQDEVSVVYARTIARKVLNARNILASMIAGPATDRLFTLVHAHVQSACDNFAGISRPLVTITVGDATYTRIKNDICTRILDRLPPLLQSLEAYTDRALNMEATLCDKMKSLPPDEFEGLLHPVFQEDEWKLVLMGGVLGVVIGFVQIYILGA